MTAKLRKIFGKTDWVVKVAQYEARLAAGEQKLAELKAERLEHALPAAEGDAAAQSELKRIVAEVAAVEREQATIQEALEQARALLTQQRQREAAEAEQKRQVELQRVAGELLDLDGQADGLMRDLCDVLDARRAKLKELQSFVGPNLIRLFTNRAHPERVAARVLRTHLDIASVVRCNESLAELDAKTLGSQLVSKPVEIVA